jgi:hypothetical protein
MATISDLFQESWVPIPIESGVELLMKRLGGASIEVHADLLTKRSGAISIERNATHYPLSRSAGLRRRCCLSAVARRGF